MCTPRMEPQDPATSTIFALPSLFLRYSASARPSPVMRCTVRSASPGGLRLKVRPAPRWSHCTSVKSRSQPLKMVAAYGLIGFPGPPCRNSSTGFAQFSPVIVTHCSMPPMGTKPASYTPVFGAAHVADETRASCAAANRRADGPIASISSSVPMVSVGGTRTSLRRGARWVS